MSKLWEKGDHLDSRVEAFTVGEDYILDRDLVPADCVASMAHAVRLMRWVSLKYPLSTRTVIQP